MQNSSETFKSIFDYYQRVAHKKLSSLISFSGRRAILENCVLQLIFTDQAD